MVVALLLEGEVEAVDAQEVLQRVVNMVEAEAEEDFILVLVDMVVQAQFGLCGLEQLVNFHQLM